MQYPPLVFLNDLTPASQLKPHSFGLQLLRHPDVISHTSWVVNICSAVPLFEKQSWHQITHFVLISVFQQIGSLVWWDVGHSAGVDGVALFCTLRIFQKENGNRSPRYFCRYFCQAYLHFKIVVD